MLDIKRIREDPEGVRAALARRDPALGELLDEVMASDEQWRAATASAEAMRAQQREQSEQLAQARKRGEDVQERQEQMKQMSAQVKELTERARVVDEQRQQALAALPNTPHPSAAEGPEDEVVREVGEVPRLGFETRDLPYGVALNVLTPVAALSDQRLLLLAEKFEQHYNSKSR